MVELACKISKLVLSLLVMIALDLFCPIKFVLSMLTFQPSSFV